MTTTAGARSRIVVLHESLGNPGGTERVLRAILDCLPDAELVAPAFGGGTTDRTVPPPPWTNPTIVPFTARRRRHALAPLYARRMARIGISQAVAVVSLSHVGWSLAASIPDGARHVAYVNGPPTVFYDERDLYLQEYPAVLRPLVAAATPALRRFNRKLLERPDRILTCSRWSARQIRAHYGRDAEVLYPPVDTRFLTPDDRERRHALVVCRLVPNKQVGVVIEAFRGRRERLVIAGGGPELDRLQRVAPANVELTGFVPDEQLCELYRASTALVCPSREEFGLVMAEALACGTPVIAPANGGALEIVQPGRTGLLLERVDPSSIASALQTLGALGADPSACRRSVLRFSEERFAAQLDQVLSEELGRSPDGLPTHSRPAAAAAR